MDFLEKDLEDIVFDTNNRLLIDRGLGHTRLARKKYRQVKIGNYGIADLITVHFYEKSFNICIRVWEFKKGKINTDTFLQGMRYLKGVQRYLERRYKEKDYFFDYQLILVGKDIDLSDSMCYIPDFFTDVYFYTYKYNFDGIEFINKYGYKLTEEGF